MSLKIPLVISAGQISRLQAGDYISSTSIPEVQTLTNAGGSTAVIGAPVYSSASGSFSKARANAVSTSKVIGLVFDTSILNAAAGLIITDGVMTATTGQWDAITGGSGGLTANAIYYLSPATAGLLTTTGTDTTGEVVAEIGVALSTTQLRIGIKTIVLL